MPSTAPLRLPSQAQPAKRPVEIGSWDTAAVIAKALTYAFSLASAGGAIFAAVFWKQLLENERLHIARASCTLAAFALALTVLRLSIIAGTLGGDIASMWDPYLLQLAFQSSEGHAALLRIAGLAFILLLPLARSPSLGIASIGGGLVAVSFAFTGHSVSLDDTVLPRLLVSAHLLGVSYWLGALYPLRMLTWASDLPRIAHIMSRFGQIALVAVGGLMAAGALLLWFLLETPLALLDTTYGQLVALKLLFVSALLGLAAVNKLMLTPSLLAGNESALRRLRLSIGAEIVLATAILAVTAAFTTIAGPPALE
jgi:putative copper resistance protein D